MSLCKYAIPSFWSGMHVIALLTKELNICQHHEQKRIAITSAHATVQKNLTGRMQTKDRPRASMIETDMCIVPRRAHHAHA